MWRIIIAFFTVVLSLNYSLVNSQVPDPRFSNLDVDDNLSSNWVSSVHRDKSGFVWFGTTDGLNRYDGYEIITFKTHNNDSNSIIDNTIYTLNEDFKGRLWIGTRHGISLLSLENMKFTTYFLNNYVKYYCEDINFINNIFQDRDSNMWVATHSGVFLFKNSEFFEVNHFLPDTVVCESPVNNIFYIDEDSKGNIWMSTYSNKLLKYHRSTGVFVEQKIPYEAGGARNIIMKIYIDNRDFLWIGGLNGLKVFDLKKPEWIDQDKSYLQTLKNTIITDIAYNNGNIWITTDGKGLFIIDQNMEILKQVKPQNYVSNSLSSSGLTCLYKDYTNIMWIGSFKNGVDFYKEDVFKFELHTLNPLNNYGINDNNINTFLETIDKKIWIGTNGGGINILDPATNIVQHAGNSNQKGLFNFNVIVSLYQDKEGIIWIGTYYEGLIRYNPANGKISVFKNDPSDPYSITDNRIWDILEDSYGQLWIATLGGGLNMLDRKTGKFKNFTTENSNISINFLSSLFEDRQHRFWVCSSYGLLLFDRGKGHFKNYFYNKDNRHSLSDNHVISIYQDSRDWIWVCTKSGLNLFDPYTERFRHFNQSRGLPGNVVYRVLEDENGNLWMSTNNGLSNLVLSKHENMHDLEYTFFNYDNSDGLQGKEFSETAALKTSDGKMYFGGTGGFNAFIPSNIKADSTIPAIAFTGLKILNNPIKIGQSLNNRILLEKSLNHTEKICLKYRENVVTIEFAAITFFHPDKNAYAYKLDGFDHSWMHVPGTHNFATYTNLNPGEYTFHVRASNYDNVWNNTGRQIKIKVLPPFYKSNFALIIYFLFIFFLLIFLRFYIVNKERNKAKLAQERNESKRQHELDTLKIRFFTNISHEIRTPLTLIMSPVEQLITEVPDEKIKSTLQVILRNSRRLLNTINQLLDFRKIEMQGIRFNPSWGDIIAFIKETVFSFIDLTEKKHIKLSLQTELKELQMMFDKDKMEKIVFNLLSNAFKFTNEGGQVMVKLNLIEEYDLDYKDSKEPKQTLQIKVIDTGIGIHASKIDKIFQRFFQDENSLGFNTNGSGIGLSLTQEFVKLHGGDITVESNEGKGSTFTVLIPVDVNQKTGHGAGQEDAIMETGILPINLSSEEEFSGESLPVLLIVEDSDDLRFYLRDKLNKNYEILDANNGKTAYQLAIEHNPDLIISDIMMPGMDGITLCGKIKTNDETSHIPFVILTAKTSDQNQLEGYETGADDYIVKPFNFQILEAKIRNILNARKERINTFKTKIEIEPKEITITPRDEVLMRKALEIVEKNISNATFSVEELSAEMGMSRMSLYRKLVSLSGKPPLEFIRTMRLKRAASLLQKSQLTISEISYQVGFNDPKYFSKYFKEEFGLLPSNYIKQYREVPKENM